MDIKLLAGFKPAIPMLRKQDERKESLLFGFEPGTSRSYMAWHLQNSSTVQFTHTYVYIYIYMCTHPHTMKVYNFIHLPCHSSDMKHLTLWEASLPGSY